MICKYCEKEYIPGKRGKKSDFCCQKCANLYRHINTEPKHQNTCMMCSVSFKTDNLNQQYCSNECRAKAKRTGRTTHEKVCPYCNKSFTTINKSQTYCCATCGSRAHGEKIRRYKNCKFCGEKFHTDHYDRYDYCSKECSINDRFGTPEERENRADSLRLQKLEARIENKICQWCGKQFTTAVSHQIYCSDTCSEENQKKLKREDWAKQYVPKEFYCLECDILYVTKVGEPRSVFCSEKCAFRNQKKKEKHKYGNKYSKGNKKRRALQIKENYVAAVSYEKLFKRDKGVCQICGMVVSKDIEKNNTWGGTIDHIIPLSKGGTHGPSNCQLAHRICNSLKSNSVNQQGIDWGQMSKEQNYWMNKVEEYKKFILNEDVG